MNTNTTPDTLQRRFLDTPGTIETITVRLERRAYSPVLRQADLPTDWTPPTLAPTNCTEIRANER